MFGKGNKDKDPKEDENLKESYKDKPKETGQDKSKLKETDKDKPKESDKDKLKDKDKSKAKKTDQDKPKETDKNKPKETGKQESKVKESDKDKPKESQSKKLLDDKDKEEKKKPKEEKKSESKQNLQTNLEHYYEMRGPYKEVDPKTRETVMSDDSDENEMAAAFSDSAVRAKFVRKVYLILSIQLGFTAFFNIPFLLLDDVQEFVYDYPLIVFIALAVFVVPYFMLVCCESTRRKSPTNIILLFLMTLGMAGVCGYVTAKFDTEVVFYSFLLTLVVTLSTTILAIFCPFDFTSCKMMVCVVSMVLAIFALISCVIIILTQSRIVSLIYAGVSVILFSLIVFRNFETLWVRFLGIFSIAIEAVALTDIISNTTQNLKAIELTVQEEFADNELHKSGRIRASVTLFAPLKKTLFMILFMMFDTQAIIGGRRVSLSPEEYILAAIQIYVDIVEIFLNFLELVGACTEND